MQENPVRLGGRTCLLSYTVRVIQDIVAEFHEYFLPFQTTHTNFFEFLLVKKRIIYDSPARSLNSEAAHFRHEKAYPQYKGFEQRYTEANFFSSYLVVIFVLPIFLALFFRICYGIL
jgi:hypothetical protein